MALRKLEVHYRPYISLQLVLILSKIHPVPSITIISFQTFLILSSYLHLGLPKGLFPSSCPTKTLHAFMYSSICTTCPAHLSHFNLRFPIMLGEEYISCSSLSYNFIFLSPRYLSVLFSNTLNLCSSLGERPSFTTIQYNW